tara:strand:+ start:142 stop:1482 length:1341 start_codon:yes stop_codon:yes gene_type:complete
MANTYLTKTLGTPTNNKKFTFSCWVKKSGTTGTMDIFHAGASGSDEAIMCRFESNGQLTLKHDVGNSQEMLKQTTALYRDTNAWYHIVTVFDTDNSTAEDRQRIYVNGERITDWASSDNFAGGEDILANKAVSHTIGKRNFDSANYLDGVLSHVHFCDGQAYDASYFGSTDSTTGEWKINTSPSVTYGNNGFFILKDGNSVTDQSGQGNNWTVSGGTLTKTEDCPSNVFATINRLNVPTSNAPTFSFGNTKTITMNTDPGYFGGTSTLGASSGKYYAEFKVTDNNGVGALGITFDPAEKARQGTTFSAQISDSFIYANNAKQYSTATGTSGSSYGNTYTDNDIIGVAMDLDNSKLYFHKNGTYQNSGVPTSGSTGTGAISITAGETYFFYLTDVGGATATYECNFGNGYFGTTAVSSAGTNASNNGIFEYDVPAGYTALSTKGLNL